MSHQFLSFDSCYNDCLFESKWNNDHCPPIFLSRTYYVSSVGCRALKNRLDKSVLPCRGAGPFPDLADTLSF